MKQQQELIPMAAGEFLKQHRIKRKLSLAAVGKAVNLDEFLLGRIEADDASDIAPVYMKGYIKTYASFLEIEPDEISRLIEQTTGKASTLQTVFTEAPRRNPVDNWLRASSYVLASLLIGTLAWQFTHEAVRLSQNGSRLHNGPEGKTLTPAISQREQSLSGPVNASITSFDVLQDEPAKPEPVLLEGEGRLEVSVSADSWVEISDAGGMELEMDLLRAGSKKKYQGKMPFKILIGQASAVRLSLNGEAIDMKPFISDNVAQMTWPQQLQAQVPISSDEEPEDN